MTQGLHDLWFDGKQDETDQHLPEYFINQNLDTLKHIKWYLCMYVFFFFFNLADVVLQS